MDDQTPRQPQAQPEPQPYQPPQMPTQPLPQSTPVQEVEPSTLGTNNPVGPSRPDVFIPPFYQPPAPKKSHKKRWIIGIAAALVVLVGGGVAAYAFWYQNPEKVVTDGIVHAMQAKSMQYTGSLNVTSDTFKVKVELTGASVANAQDLAAKVTIPLDDKDIAVEGEGMFDSKNDLYIRMKNLDKVVAPLRASMAAPARAPFDKIIAKINNQWIKITVGDLSGLSEEAAKTQSCIGDAIKQYSNDQAAIAEVTDVYKKNKFITVNDNLGTKDGSLGYTMTSDTAKAKAFANDLKTTKIYKSLHDCDNSFVIDEDDFAPSDKADEDTTTTHTEVWVSQWTHEITKVSSDVTNDDLSTKVETIFEPKFDTGVTVETPAQSTTLEQLKADIEKLAKEAQKSQIPLTTPKA